MSSAVPQSQFEFDFLCLLACAQLNAERIEHIKNQDLSAVDWNTTLRLAEQHGILALVARNLLQHVRGLPLQIEGSLRAAYDANVRRGLWFASEMARIAQHFERRQVRAIPYKGPVLAQMVYNDVALRSFSDLDFLIAPHDFEGAKQALLEVGYRPSSDITPAFERYWLHHGYERSFDGAAGKYLVELQWALLPRFNAIDLQVDDLLARGGRATVGGCEVPSLSPEDLLLVLCLHTAKHLWTRLIWLVDIAETLRSQTIDYAVVFSRARALGVARILGVSFWLVQNVLHADVPQAAQAMIAVDSGIPALGVEFAARLRRGATYDFESTEYFRLSLKLRERLSDRLRYLWRLVWTPGVGDFAAVRLPEAFFPFYRVVRMGRLIRKAIGSRRE
jgi:hypothetical protein